MSENIQKITCDVDYCKYNDCRHVLEQECGIREAVLEGEIASSRFENFKTFYDELSKRKIY